MSQTTEDLNKRTRKLEAQKMEKGEELVQQQQYQNQIQAINSERMKNLAIERQDAMAQGQTLETMSMAGAMATQPSGGGTGVQQLAPQTQATLGKYGLVGQPKVQRQSHRDVQIKPNNITINNTYNTTTTNNVSGGGPTQGRPVQISAASTTEARSQGRFKTWMENVFTQQKEQNTKRVREYEKREWSLSKSVNKMLRKMEDSTRSVAKALDPRGIGTTVASQLKTLFWLFGIHFLAQNWDKIMNIGSKVYGGIVTLLGKFGLGEEGRKRRAEGTDILGDLFWFLTGDRKKSRDGKTSLVSVFKDIFKSFGDYIKLWFEKQMALREVAVKQVKMPNFDWRDIGGSIAAIGGYLGDLLQAIAAPAAAATKSLNKNMAAQADNSSAAARQREGTNAFKGFNDGSSTMYGDYALEAGGKKRYTNLEYAIGQDGKLREGVGVEVGQGRDILGAYNDAKNYGAVDISRVYAGINRLEEAAKKRGGVVLDEEFVKRMFGPAALASGKFEKVRTKYIRVDNDDLMRNMQDDYTGLNGDISKEILTGAVAGTVLGGGLQGTLTGAGAGLIVGGGKLAVRGFVNDKHHLRLVDADDPRYKDIPAAVFKGQSLTGGNYYRIKAEDFQALMQRFDPEKTGSKDIIFNNIRQDLINYGGGQAEVNRKYNLVGKSSNFGQQYRTDVNAAMKDYREIERINKEYDTRLDNSEAAVQTRALGDRAMYVANQAYQYAGGAMQSAGRWLNKTFSGKSESGIKRQEYMMDVLTTKGGLKPSAAAGVIGNLKHEGLLLQDLGRLNDDNGCKSGGIAGFATARGGSLETGELGRLRAYAGDRWNTFEAQANYLVEGSPAAGAALAKIREATANLNDQDSARMAAIIWGHEYERFSGHRAYDLQGNLTGQDRNVHFTFNGKRFSKDGASEYDKRIAEAQGTFEFFSSGNYATSPTSYSSASGGGTGGGYSYSSGGGGSSSQSVTINTTPASSNKEARVGCCGDSWMAGCVGSTGKLTEKLAQAGFQVYAKNADNNDVGTYKSGANRIGVTKYVAHAVSQGCNIIVINYGINDLLSTDYIEQVGNAAKDAKVYFNTIPYDLRDHKNRPQLSNDSVTKFNSALANICKSRGWNLIGVHTLGDVGCEDFHPKGYGKIADLIVSTLKNGATVSVNNAPGQETSTSSGGYSYSGYSGTGSVDFGEGGTSAGDWLIETGQAMEGGELFSGGKSLAEIEAIKQGGLLRAEAVEILARARDMGFIYNAKVEEKDKDGNEIPEDERLTGWDLSRFMKTYDQEEFMDFWSNLSQKDREAFLKKFKRAQELEGLVNGIEGGKVQFIEQGGSKFFSGQGFEDKKLFEAKLQEITGKKLDHQNANQYQNAGNNRSLYQNQMKTRADLYNMILEGRFEEADKLAKSANPDKVKGSEYKTFEMEGRDTIDGFGHGTESRKFYYDTFKYGIVHGQDYLDLIAKYVDAKRQLQNTDEDDVETRSQLNALINALEKRKNIYEDQENNLTTHADDTTMTKAAVMDFNKKHAAGEVRLLDLQEARAQKLKELEASSGSMGLMEWYKLYEEQIGAFDREIESVQIQLKELEGASNEEIAEFRAELQRHKEWEALSEREINSMFSDLNISDKDYWKKVQKLYEKYGRSALDRVGVTVDEMKEIMKTYEDEALKQFTEEQRLLYVRLSKFKNSLDAAMKVAQAAFGGPSIYSVQDIYNAMTGTGNLTPDQRRDIAGIIADNGLQYDLETGVVKDRSGNEVTVKSTYIQSQGNSIAAQQGYSNYDSTKTAAENVRSMTTENQSMYGVAAPEPQDFTSYMRSSWGTNNNGFDIYSNLYSGGTNSKAEGGWTPDGPVMTPYHYEEGGQVASDVTFHAGEYVIPKYMTQIPSVRAHIDKLEAYRTSTIAGQRVGQGKVREPEDYTKLMVAYQSATNDLLQVIAKTNSAGFNKVATVTAASSVQAPTPPPPATRTFNYS